ncbi:hypothetical protein ACFSYC_16005 [Mucilaginibacter antarcticus]|uniref:Lipocalin-like protein n=2 Tax=Mucilaginibacter antarcticus TaxID=1855725 RepID=A0ABW5XSX4_9SPHI
MLTAACKKLDSIPPSSTNPNDDDTVLGITVIRKQIYNSYLTSTWKVSNTIIEYYDDNDVVISGAPTGTHLFNDITLDDTPQTFSFTGLPANTAGSSGKYELSTSQNVLFIKLPKDLFSRSGNFPVWITRLNSRSMVWIALDENPSNVNAKSVRKAYHIIFYK